MKAVRCSVSNSDKVRWGSRCLIVLMAAALLLGATWIGYAEENEVETGDIDLRDVMTFEEAEQLLQEDGLEPIMAATKRIDKNGGKNSTGCCFQELNQISRLRSR